MKKHAAMVLSVLFLASQVTLAYVDFDSGGTTTIGYSINDFVRADFNIANSPGTHLIVTDGANISKAVISYHNSRITVNGGTVKEISAQDNSRVVFTGNAESLFVIGIGDSRINIGGGTITYYIEAYDNVRIFITGGDLRNNLYAIGNGIITMAGTGFKVGNVAVDGYLNIPYLVSVGALTDYAGIDGTSHEYIGTLTGTLADGTPLPGNAIIINHWLDNGAGVLMDDANFNFVPEPATMLLLALGGLVLRRKK